MSNFSVTLGASTGPGSIIQCSAIEAIEDNESATS